MLTQSEREWLRNRKRENDLYLFCKHCTVSPRTDDCYWNHVVGACPIYPDIEDALDFSERVAVKLATDENCGVDEDCPPDMPFGWGRLKAARLAVEEEMDGTD